MFDFLPELGNDRPAGARDFDFLYGSWTVRKRALRERLVGSFDGDRDEFRGQEQFQGRPVDIRCIWTRQGDRQARWEQAYSEDDGNIWEVNWVMEFNRVAEGL